MSWETLLVEIPAPHLRVVTLNRPAVRNALNTQMGHDLTDLCTRLADDPDVWCVVLTGAGDKAFCAGADLKERNGMSDAAWRAQHVIFERAFWGLLDFPKPLIAAVNGPCFAGGLEMALACDFIHAVDTARFALTEVSLGLMPGGMGTQTLPRAVGMRRAKEIILTARPFSAAEALEWGMVNALHPAAELMPKVLEVAAAICANAPLSVRQAKTSIHRGASMSLADGVRFEIEAYNNLISTRDRMEGVRAFNEKRKPNFKGE